VRPRAVDERDVFPEYAAELARAEDEQVVEALAAHAPQGPLAHGVRAGACGGSRRRRPRRRARRSPRTCGRDRGWGGRGAGRTGWPRGAAARPGRRSGGTSRRQGRPAAWPARRGSRRTAAGRAGRPPGGRRRPSSRGRGSAGRSPRPARAGAGRAYRGRWDRMARLATRRPGLPGSPRIRSAPRSGCTVAIRRIAVTVSAGSGGRPGPGRDSRRQHGRKPARCQRGSAPGRTMGRACRQARTRPASGTRGARSAGVTTGRLTPRRSTSSCWRRKGVLDQQRRPAARQVAPGPRRVRRRQWSRPQARADGVLRARRGGSTNGGTHARAPARRCSSAPRCNPREAQRHRSGVILAAGRCYRQRGSRARAQRDG